MAGAFTKNLRHHWKLWRNRLVLIRRFDVLLERGVTVKYPEAMEFGVHTTVQSGAYLYGSRAGKPFRIGQHSVISMGCVILGEGGVELGDYVHLGPQVVITTQLGDSRTDQCVQEPAMKYAPVRLGAGTWVGAGSIIMPGADLGARTIVAPASLVFGKFPEGAKLSGNPARPQNRF
jgi:acetyltransferase-like isoleucine patch superfamily enzyme